MCRKGDVKSRKALITYLEMSNNPGELYTRTATCKSVYLMSLLLNVHYLKK
jgi:hypothetical protein